MTRHTNISDNDRLMLCALLRSEDGRIKLADLVDECVRRFPKDFAYRETPYPDTGKVEKRAWSCRTDKGWLAGSSADGFYVLTPAGVDAAMRVAARLGVRIPDSLLRQIGFADRVSLVVRSRAFAAYLDNGNLTSVLVAEAIGLPPEATRRQIKQALRGLLGEAKMKGYAPVVNFVNYCEEKLNLKGDPGK